jgi:long-chain acyl-CoA synthetase
VNVLYCLRRATQFYGSCPASHRDGGSLTWAELGDRVRRAAAFLRGLGLDKADRLAVWMRNSHEYLELYYATAMAGIVIVPLNTRWNIDDINRTMADAGVTALVVDEHVVSETDQVQRPRHLIFAGKGPCPSGMVAYGYATPSVPFEEPASDDLVGLFYTSGTTGGAKGVMLTHRNVWSNVLHTMVAEHLTQPVWLHAAPMFHLADQASVPLVANAGGAHVFLPSFDPKGFLIAVQTHRVTDTSLVPTMLSALLEHPSFERYDLSSLKCIRYGASPMPLPLLRTAMARIPSARFEQHYGMTETSPTISVLAHEDHVSPAVASVGKPVPGVEVRIVDDADGDVQTGTSGEIIVRGENVMRGYWNRPAITATVLRDGWMHTGDIGRFDARGFLYVLDREKDMIKPGGENVYSPEVESMLAAHPAVLEAAVIGVPDRRWGETIRAVVVRHASASLTEQELIEWCRARMTHFKCPASVVFVEALPNGASGKVEKNVLRDRFAQPVTQ